MDTIKLTAQPREESGKGPARRLRAAGQVPAVLYGRGKETASLAVPVVALRDALAGGQHTVLEIEVAGTRGGRFAVVKQMQMHPTKRSLLHLDLQEVDLKVEIESPVTIVLHGDEAPGVKAGGILDQVLHEVTVRALPQSMPDSLTADLSGVEIADQVRVRDLRLPAGVAVLDDPDMLVGSVLPPITQERLEEALETAPAEMPAETAEAEEE